ncbi:type III-B CRISPR module-associated protein Cmr5 [Paenibacillus sp. A3M_27_13]|uniref:type III-B CRISPR module-associated protein Cmr5 n=1 Tax=Paenibacillus sp. A3M_27_13 TaxID=2962029 RepID=UPI0020B865E7|nr:type III-B CRISPR module-associated protein Cmr5 [Paenibacillus sp. A3M_27_13]MCP3746782.1 type III-B CRISPR module-associated protein Cmr5 [Paenibacillus sp. A3M_27_13]
MKSSQHEYAQAAFEGIKSLDADSVVAQQYGQLCHRFPSLVLTNGLRLAVTFFQAKSKSVESPHALYLQHMWNALGLDRSWNDELRKENADYLHLSRRVLSASVWFKRYAEAILKIEQGTDAPEQEGIL